eukprot:1154070-Pelagomonas_calceolata.AAC.2
MQDLCLDLSEQPCTLSLCRWVPRVWDQKSGKMQAKVGSPGSYPPACLTSSDGWALYQEHVLGGPWGWGRVEKIAQFWQGKAEIYARGTGCASPEAYLKAKMWEKLGPEQASLAEQQLDPEQVRAVQASCCELHTVRYGADVSEVDLQRLVAANKSNHGLVEALAQAEFEAA